MADIEKLFTIVPNAKHGERYIVCVKQILPPTKAHLLEIEWHGWMQVMKNVAAVVNEGTYRLARVEEYADKPHELHLRFVFQCC